MEHTQHQQQQMKQQQINGFICFRDSSLTVSTNSKYTFNFIFEIQFKRPNLKN
jgi:hypothetical protein